MGEKIMEKKTIFAILFSLATLYYLFIALVSLIVSPMVSIIFLIVVIFMVLTIVGIFKKVKAAKWTGFIIAGIGILDGLSSVLNFFFGDLTVLQLIGHFVLAIIYLVCFILLIKIK